jgi:branched-chain amino acid transport system permease protein
MAAVALSGLFVGLVYGLLAIGLVLTYQVSRVINFAYGELGMLAAFVYLDLRLGRNVVTPADHGLLVSVPVALVVGATLGALLEVLVARPLRNDPTVKGMVATIAASLLFLTIGVQRWGGDVRPTKPLIDGDGVKVLGLQVTPSQLLIALCTAGLLAALACIYRFTSLGLRLRATAMDPYAAALSGIDINTTSVGVWAIAGALSAASAVLITPLASTSVLFMTLLALRSFAAALLGGLTSLVGAFLGGVSLGVLESVIAFTSPVSGVTDAAVAGLIIVLMLVRPGGLVRAAY